MPEHDKHLPEPAKGRFRSDRQLLQSIMNRIPEPGLIKFLVNGLMQSLYGALGPGRSDLSILMLYFVKG